MSNFSKSNVIDIVNNFAIDDESNSLISIGVISGVVVKNRKIGFVVDLDKLKPFSEQVRELKDKLLSELSNVEDINIV